MTTSVEPRQCMICLRQRNKGQFLISLTRNEVRCSDAVDCSLDLEKQRLDGRERHLRCTSCLRYMPLRVVRMAMPMGYIYCIDQGECKSARTRGGRVYKYQ